MEEVPSENHWCPYCPKEFASARGVAIHIKRSHQVEQAAWQGKRGYRCLHCHWETFCYDNLQKHWQDACPDTTRLSELTSSNNANPPPTVIQRGVEITVSGIEDHQQRVNQEFPKWAKEVGLRLNKLHPDSCEKGEDWVMNKKLHDVVGLSELAIKHGFSDTAIEETVSYMKELAGPDSFRIHRLPSTWRTMRDMIMQGFDTKTMKDGVSFPVPPELGLPFTEVPIAMKTFKAVLEELLFDPDLMGPGDFIFGDRTDPAGKESCITFKLYVYLALKP